MKSSLYIVDSIVKWNDKNLSNHIHPLTNHVDFTIFFFLLFFQGIASHWEWRDRPGNWSKRSKKSLMNSIMRRVHKKLSNQIHPLTTHINFTIFLLFFQGITSHWEWRDRPGNWSKRSRQGEVPIEWRPQMVGYDLRSGQLQDRTMQKATKVV